MDITIPSALFANFVLFLNTVLPSYQNPQAIIQPAPCRQIVKSNQQYNLIKTDPFNKINKHVNESSLVIRSIKTKHNQKVFKGAFDNGILFKGKFIDHVFDLKTSDQQIWRGFCYNSALLGSWNYNTEPGMVYIEKQN